MYLVIYIYDVYINIQYKYTLHKYMYNYNINIQIYTYVEHIGGMICQLLSAFVIISNFEGIAKKRELWSRENLGSNTSYLTCYLLFNLCKPHCLYLDALMI